MAGHVGVSDLDQLTLLLEVLFGPDFPHIKLLKPCSLFDLPLHLASFLNQDW